ncbi:MAG: ABC transporter permease [Sumerlaeia bacterium]
MAERTDQTPNLFKSIHKVFETLFLTTGGIALLFVESLSMLRLSKGDIRRLLRQGLVIGVQTAPLACLVGLFTGMIIAINIGIPLEDFGVEERIGEPLGISIVREFAPVFTAFIIAARVGAAMTAELGTMAVNDEIDALRAMGIRPTRFLAMPRIVSSLVLNPVLTLYSIAFSLLGGAIISSTYFSVPTHVYWDNVFGFVDFKELANGLGKALVFGGLYSSICVWHGLETRGGAAGVGRSTTRAVVTSLTCILLFDFILTRFMFG